MITYFVGLIEYTYITKYIFMVGLLFGCTDLCNIVSVKLMYEN